jgi:hypothetical protein
VPASSLVRKYDTMAAQEEKRRENLARRRNLLARRRERKLKAERAAETKRLAREMAKLEREAKFTANEVPETSSKLLLGELEASREAARAERLRNRARETLAHSKLPSRMAESGDDEESRRADRRLRRAAWASERELTFAPMVNPTVPDHYKLQRAFEAELAERREALAKRTTVPKPFRLHGGCEYVSHFF